MTLNISLPDGLVAPLFHDGGRDPLVGPWDPLLGYDTPHSVEETLNETYCFKSQNLEAYFEKRRAEEPD